MGCLKIHGAREGVSPPSILGITKKEFLVEILDGLTRLQIFEGYQIWCMYFDHRLADEKIEPFLSEDIQPMKDGWLRKAREALFLSTGEMAKRLKVSRSAYSKLERNEKVGGVLLRTLAEAAEAMDCELVYAIRPKNHLKFSQVIWEKILPEARRHPWVKSSIKYRKATALAGIARYTMGKIKFRRQHKWIER